MADLMEEVQSILGRRPEGTKGGAPVTEMKDPADEARDLLNTHTNLSKMLQKKLDAVTAAFAKAKVGAQRLDRVGSGTISAPDLLGGEPLRSLKDLAKFINGAVSHAERTIKDAKRGSGSMGFREDRERYLDFLDARVGSLSEIRKPMSDSAPDNAGVNDYSAELVAAAQQAAGYINSMSQLQMGSAVHIGRKSLYVCGPPKMTSQGMLVHLEPPENEKGHLNTGDAYTLMIPVEGPEGAPPKMGSAQMHVQPTAEAVLTLGDRSVKILAADLRLESGDFGDHMTNYGDYGPAMGRIKPGDKVSGILTPTVFRVIGKSGNSALVQPDSMDRAMYGRFKGASQYERTPVGQSTPSVPSVELWKPGMGRIPAGSDFAGRGGKGFQDTSTSTPAATPTSQDGMSGSGSRTSLAGTRVLNYNPHSGKYQMATGKMPGDYEMADTIQIVGHDPSLPTAVGEEMTLDRFEHALDEASGESVIEKLEAVVEANHAMKVNGVLMEPDIASVMLQLYRSVNEANQARMGEMGVHEMLDVSQKMLVRLAEAGSKPKADAGKNELGEGQGMKPGEGGRFEKLKKSIAAKGDVDDPAAVAAAIGRKKYGKGKFQKMAAAGKKEEVETALFFRNGRSAEAALESVDLEGIEHELDGSKLLLRVSENQLGELGMTLLDARFSFMSLDEAMAWADVKKAKKKLAGALGVKEHEVGSEVYSGGNTQLYVEAEKGLLSKAKKAFPKATWSNGRVYVDLD